MALLCRYSSCSLSRSTCEDSVYDAVYVEAASHGALREAFISTSVEIGRDFVLVRARLHLATEL